MLIKELSKKSKIPVKDLLVTPTGILCYIIDCLNSNLCIDEIYMRLKKLNLSNSPMLNVIDDKSIIEKVLTDYENIESINAVYNLC